VQEYLIDLNSRQAAIRCGYDPKTADRVGIALRSDVNIFACIARAEAERSKRTGINADITIRELARIGRANPAKVIMDDGSINPDASDDDLAAIQSIKVKTIPGKNGPITEREVRFHDKTKALELLMKAQGMLIERKQVDVHTTVSDMTNEEREKKINELLAKRANTIDIDSEICE